MYHDIRLMPSGSQPQPWRLDKVVIMFVGETYDISLVGLLLSSKCGMSSCSMAQPTNVLYGLSSEVVKGSDFRD